MTITTACAWTMCDTDQDHTAATAPSPANPDCTCHKVDGLRLVLRHEAGCPRHAEFHHPDNSDCQRYCKPDGAGQTFLVIVGQIVGNAADWTTAYNSDQIRHTDRQAAIDHGLRELGHDDFCVGTLDADGRLVAYGWGMDDFARDDRDPLAEIGRYLGLDVKEPAA